MTRVLALAGGPDAEREISLRSAAAIARALRAAPEMDAETLEIDTLTLDALRDCADAHRADVVWPALHGPWGEGGPMQDLLERVGRPYVGSGPLAARLAMDKVATKTIARDIGLHVNATAVVRPGDAQPPLPLPVVVKPVHEGSTIGLSICHEIDDWVRARDDASQRKGPAMIEPFVEGRELTVGLIEDTGAGAVGFGADATWRALPVIEIVPKEGLYDYEAKYSRDDTRYIVDPALHEGIGKTISEQSIALARALGCRSLARVDFILNEANEPMLLEINTMPGFTNHSLVPMAAQAAGVDMASLCAMIVNGALQNASTPAQQALA